jgi:hypothetical protein
MMPSFLLLVACGHDCPHGEGWADGGCVDLLDTGGLETRAVCPDLDPAVPGKELPDEFELCIDPLATGACPLRSKLDDGDILDDLTYVDTG